MASGKTYLVTYDLRNATSSEYAAVEAVLGRMCSQIFTQQGSACWMVGSASTAEQIKNAVFAASNKKATSIWVAEVAQDALRAFYPKSS